MGSNARLKRRAIMPRSTRSCQCPRSSVEALLCPSFLLPPWVLHPIPDQPRVVLLKPLVQSPLIEVGEYSYNDDPDDPTAFDTRNVIYHYGPEKLRIGKYCALGTGVRFIMNGANHRMDGPSTFPFPIMGGSWAEHADLLTEGGFSPPQATPFQRQW
jgi:hypothetical protein